MMQAADRPWRARPGKMNQGAGAPLGATAIRNEPTMLRRKPILTTLTRPTRSARPPMTTMKMPENRAVIATAMFIRLLSRPRSFCMSGATFNVVWAKSQKVITPRMMPIRSLSVP